MKMKTTVKILILIVIVVVVTIIFLSKREDWKCFDGKVVYEVLDSILLIPSGFSQIAMSIQDVEAYQDFCKYRIVAGQKEYDLFITKNLHATLNAIDLKKEITKKSQEKKQIQKALTELERYLEKATVFTVNAPKKRKLYYLTDVYAKHFLFDEDREQIMRADSFVFELAKNYDIQVNVVYIPFPSMLSENALQIEKEFYKYCTANGYLKAVKTEYDSKCFKAVTELYAYIEEKFDIPATAPMFVFENVFYSFTNEEVQKILSKIRQGGKQ